MSEETSPEDIFHSIVFFLLLLVLSALTGYSIFTYLPIGEILKWILSILAFTVILVILWIMFGEIDWDWW